MPFVLENCTLPFLLIALGAFSSCGSPDPMPSDCSVFPAQQTSPYVLPYEVGQSFKVSKTTSHGGTQYYSVDFVMPTGTPVVASRSGQVVNTEMRFLDGDTVPDHFNLIWIQHADGTVARYFHLSHQSALVNNGDSVSQGQVIASSDNTGYSTGPHLHFDVVQCLTGLTPADINTPPCAQSLPLSFRNTLEHTCGLEDGKYYPALPY
jgi:murein DD-endopeptidase MepM/ murein hydrolase activator NlpD